MPMKTCYRNAQKKLRCSRGVTLRWNLRKRGKKLEDLKCFFCNCVEEDGAHLFVKCKAVKEIWRLLEETMIILEVVDSMSQPLDLIWQVWEVKCTVIILCWGHWWNNRNKLWEGEFPIPGLEIAHYVLVTGTSKNITTWAWLSTVGRCTTGWRGEGMPTTGHRH